MGGEGGKCCTVDNQEYFAFFFSLCLAVALSQLLSFYLFR